MARGVRVKEGEDFSRATIKKVISLLESDKPITKKAACEILNMTYNTTRLNNIIEKFKEREEFAKKRRASLRGTALSDLEKKTIISNYLDGVSLSDIEDMSYRSIITIKRLLKEYSIPERETTKNFEPIFLPDDSIQSSYEKGDLVFSAKYNSVAKVHSKYSDDVYRIWIYDKYQQWAYQPYWELGSLVPIQKELGIDIEDMPGDEIRSLINQALITARKLKNAER